MRSNGLERSRVGRAEAGCRRCSITRHRAFAIAAADNAPTSAPAPKHAEMTPNVRGPASRVFFASNGSKMLKLKQTEEKITIITGSPTRSCCSGRRRKPSRVPRQTWAGRGRERVQLRTRIASRLAEHGEEA